MLLAHVAHKKRDENGDEKVESGEFHPLHFWGFSFSAVANQGTCDEKDFAAPCIFHFPHRPRPHALVQVKLALPN